jgi:hypothetical protein
MDPTELAHDEVRALRQERAKPVPLPEMVAQVTC